MAANGKHSASVLQVASHDSRLCENRNVPEEKGKNQIVKMLWFFSDCKLLFDLLIFSLEYERISLASAVKNNS